MNTITTPAPTEYLPFLTPLAVNCYAVVIATGRAGKVGNKYWNKEACIPTWGVEYASEYRSGELCRITPAQYHALPDSLKITKDNPCY